MEKMMRSILKNVPSDSRFIIPIILFAIFFSGCSHDYSWRKYPIAPERVSLATALKPGKSINIIEENTGSERRLLGTVGPHKYFGSNQQLAQGILVQISEELTLREIKVSGNTRKSLKISVLDAHMTEGIMMRNVDMEVRVAAGNGYERIFTVSNRSPTSASADYSYNGAVALVVIDVLNDEKILGYINE
ncbi:MAG: hypothetical protein R6W72_05920 [Desulfurivibrionaceae bacterium]